MMVSTINSAPGASIRKLTPKGRSVSSSTREISASTSSALTVAVARKPIAPALQQAATISGVAIHPIAVWMIGC
jgi:hypothetical protein